MKQLFSTLLLLACATTVFAQFALEAQYIPRTELRNGFKKPISSSQNPAFFTEHRARLIAAYKAEKFGVKLSVQDVRIWGETGQINKSDQLLSAHEAYGEFYASAKSTFRVGRQEVIYDGHRLFGSLDWAMQGRALDAVRYLFNDGKGTQFDLMAAWNQTGYGDGAPEPAKLYGTDYTIITGGGTNPRIFNLALPKALIMAYYKKAWDGGDIGIMLLNDTYTSTDSTSHTHSDFTIGITPNFKLGKLKLGGQFYYTGGAAGKTRNGSQLQNIDLGGYMFNLHVAHSEITGKPELGIDYLSGDDESTAKIEGWSPKYGTNHKFYGFMDYFYVGNGHGGANAKSAGLIDVYLKTAFKLGEKTNLGAHLHYFSSPQARTNTSTRESYDGYLGTELDLVISRSLSKGVDLKAGYSQMFGISDTLKQLKFGNPEKEINDLQCWAWIMLSFKPKFL